MLLPELIDISFYGRFLGAKGRELLDANEFDTKFCSHSDFSDAAHM